MKKIAVSGKQSSADKVLRRRLNRLVKQGKVRTVTVYPDGDRQRGETYYREEDVIRYRDSLAAHS